MNKGINNYLGCFSEGLTQSFNFKAYKKMFLLNLAQNTIFFLFLGAWFILLTTIGFILFSRVTFPQSVLELENLFANNILGILIIIILSFLGFLSFISLLVYFFATNLRLAESVVSGKIIGVMDALLNAKKGFFSALKTVILWNILLLIGLAIILVPLIWLILQTSPNLNNLITNPASLLFLFLIGFLFIVLLFLVLFLISPFTTLLFPVAFFGEKGAIYSIKETLRIVKQDYLLKILYVFLIGLLAGSISTINYFVNLPINLFGEIFLAIAGFGGPLTSGIAYIVYLLSIIFIGLLFSSAISLVNTVLIVKLYKLSK